MDRRDHYRGGFDSFDSIPSSSWGPPQNERRSRDRHVAVDFSDFAPTSSYNRSPPPPMSRSPRGNFSFHF